MNASLDSHRREAARLAELERLGAVGLEADRVLQELVDGAREAFGTELCMANLIASDVQYFTAWSGELPLELAEAGQDPRERGMCRYVVEAKQPFVVEDLLATERFKDQHFRVRYGVRFYAGTPLITADGVAVGSLCLLDTSPRGFGERDLATLRAFARAVVGRLEALAAKESETRCRRNIFELANDAILILDPESGLILDANERACETYRLPRERLVGEAIEVLSLEPEQGRRHMQDLLGGGSCRDYETCHRRGDGTPMNVSINSSVVEYGGRRAVLSINRDVTERKRAEGLLRERSAAITASIDGMAILDHSGVYTYMNVAHARIYGYDDPEELLGRTWDVLYDEEQLGWFERHTAPALRRDGHWRGEATGKKRDGSPFPQELSITTVEGGGFVCVVRDITERKRAEEELRRSEARSRAILDASPDSMFLYGRDGEYLDVLANKAGKLYLPREELIGRKVGDVLPPEVAQPFLQEIARALDTRETRTYEYRLEVPEGVLDFEAYLVASGPNEVLCVARDVTERKRSEETLRFQAQLLDAVGQAVVAVDLEGRIVYWNRAAEGLYGWAAQEAVGRTAQEVMVSEDQLDRAGGIWAELAAGRSWSGEFVVRRRDGVLLPVMVTNTPVFDQRGSLVGIIGVSADITQRKRAEAALRESEERHRRQAKELKLLHRVRTALARELEPSAVFRTVVEAIARTYGYTQVSVYRLQGETLVLEHQVGYERVLDRIPMTRGIIGRVVRTRQPVLLGDVRSDPAFLGAIEGITSEVCVPLFDEGEVVGALNVESTSGVELTEDDLRLMGGLAEHVNGAVSRARLYAQVRKSEERFRSLVQNASDLITMVDADGTITYESPSKERILGYGPEELVGRHVLEHVHPDDHGRVSAEFANVLAHPGYVPEEPVGCRYRHADGSWRWLEAVANNLLFDPAVGGIVINSRDVTERKRFEEALRQSEARFRAIFERSAMGISIANPDRRLLETNPFYQRMLGYSGEELFGKPIAEISYPEDVPEDDELNGALLAGELDFYQREKRYVKKDGEVVWVRPTISAVRNDEGEPQFLIGMVEDITERKQAEERLREAEEKYRTLVEQMPAVTYTQEVDHNNTLSYVGPQIEALLGYPAQEYVSDPGLWIEHIYPDDRERVLAEDRRTDETGEPFRIEYRKVARDGRVVWVRDEAVLVKDSAGRPRFWQGVMTDITERKEAEERLSILADATFEGIVVTAGGRILEVNEAYAEMHGYEASEIVGRSVLDLTAPEDRARVSRNIVVGHEEPYEIVGMKKDGTRIDVEVRGRTFSYGGRVARVAAARDVSERKAYERRLRHQTLHDVLTKLPNRTLFTNRLEQSLARVSRRKDQVAVLFLDLDNFKVINDSLGHDAGDRLLVEVAERLETCLRPEDTAARFGGDEFVVLLEEVGGADDAVRVAERISGRLLGTPFVLKGHEVFVAPSIGIALSGPGRDTPEKLLRDADVAMYRAKEDKTRYRMFDPSMDATAMEHLRLQNDLRRAVAGGELSVHYQPKVRIDSGEVVGLEALLRWEHPERGAVDAGDVVRLAEEIGVMDEIGRMVLREACQRAKEWRGRHAGNVGHPQPFVCVNLSAKQLRQPGLVGDIADVLEKTGLEGGALVLEITESAAMDEVETVSAALRQLKQLGVGLAMDDLGTGYSSLSRLGRFPFDFLKIDRSIVAEMDGDASKAAVVSAAVGLAHALGMKAVAEGVEQAGEHEKLRELGCDLGQGCYWWEPLPAEAVAAVLREAE